MPLQVDVQEKPGGSYITIDVAGSLDANTFTQLAAAVEAVLKKPVNLVIFNLEKVHYVSSAGIGVVLAAEKALKAKGGKALVVNLKPQIKKVFDIVQALPKQQVFTTVQELDAYLSEIQKQVREGGSQ